MDLLGRLLEGGDYRPPSTPLGDRIAAVAGHPAQAFRFLSRIGERHEVRAAKSDVATAPHHGDAQHPPTCAGRSNDKIEPVAVAVAAGFFDLLDEVWIERVVSKTRWHRQDAIVCRGLLFVPHITLVRTVYPQGRPSNWRAHVSPLVQQNVVGY